MARVAVRHQVLLRDLVVAFPGGAEDDGDAVDLTSCLDLPGEVRQLHQLRVNRGHQGISRTVLQRPLYLGEVPNPA
jgi:hypothetical protein